MKYFSSKIIKQDFRHQYLQYAEPLAAEGEALASMAAAAGASAIVKRPLV